MVKKTRLVAGMLLALLLMALSTPAVLLYKTSKKLFSKTQSLSDYFYQLSVSTSQYYAAFLYEEEDWTTSSLTFKKEDEQLKIKLFRIFIDFLLGENHCKKSFENEKKEIKTQGEQL